MIQAHFGVEKSAIRYAKQFGGEVVSREQFIKDIKKEIKRKKHGKS